MDKGSKVLGWLGLIVGGTLSVGANVRSIHLPGMPAADAGAYVVAVAPVILAMLGIEQVSRWKHLPRALRFGAVGIASLIAAVASWTHIVAVMRHYGQPEAVALSFPLAVDGIMLLSSVALFVPFPSVDTDTVQPDMDMTARAWTPAPSMDSLDTDEPEPLTDTDKALLSTDMSALYVPDSLDTPAPVDIVDRVPAPRRTRPDNGWRVSALDMIRTGEPATDREIAEKILADAPDTWSTVEAGRRAVGRLRTTL